MSHAAIVQRAKRMKKPLPRFDFGRYNGIDVATVFRDNPGYIVWCWENFRNRGRLPFIEELYLRAKAIVRDMEYEEGDDYDIMDDPMEHWARELAGE